MINDFLKNITKESLKKAKNIQNKEYEYSCKNWQFDENKFIQPSDVQFQDLTKLQEQIQNIPRF